MPDFVANTIWLASPLEKSLEAALEYIRSKTTGENRRWRKLSWSAIVEPYPGDDAVLKEFCKDADKLIGNNSSSELPHDAPESQQCRFDFNKERDRAVWDARSKWNEKHVGDSWGCVEICPLDRAAPFYYDEKRKLYIVSLEFQSAWNTPLPALKTLHAQLPDDVELTVRGRNEATCQIVCRWTIPMRKVDAVAATSSNRKRPVASLETSTATTSSDDDVVSEPDSKKPRGEVDPQKEATQQSSN
jgi:hypothetical protein